MNKQQRQKLQQQSINLLELIEDISEQFCDEEMMSGEQFYVMMKALVDCKLKEFPLDFEQLEEDIYSDEDDNEDWMNNINPDNFIEDN